MPYSTDSARTLINLLTGGDRFARVFRRFITSPSAAAADYSSAGENPVTESLAAAELVTSELAAYTIIPRPRSKTVHAPVLDLDYSVTVVPSGTPGHHHLYVNKALTWRQYRRLLRELARAGIIERGFARASIRNRYSAVRVPWRPKV